VGKIAFIHQACDSLHSSLLALHGPIVAELEIGEMVPGSSATRLSAVHSHIIYLLYEKSSLQLFPSLIRIPSIK
jgi:hypothetical protein